MQASVRPFLLLPTLSLTAQLSPSQQMIWAQRGVALLQAYIRAHTFLLLLCPSPSPILFQRCFRFSFAVRSVTGLTTARTASTKTF